MSSKESEARLTDTIITQLQRAQRAEVNALEKEIQQLKEDLLLRDRRIQKQTDHIIKLHKEYYERKNAAEKFREAYDNALQRIVDLRKQLGDDPGDY